MELIYRFCAELVRIIFWLNGQALQLIVNLSKYQFFDSDVIEEFTNKVYVILGVLMLFKLVISAIEYLINPDRFDDKNKGMGAILTRSIVAVALIVLVPVIFEYAIKVQDIVVVKMPQMFFGGGIDLPTKDNGDYDLNNVGTKISNAIVSGFLEENKGAQKNKDINTIDNPWDYPQVLLEGCGSNIIWETDKFISGEKCVYNAKWLLVVPIGIYLVFLFISMAVDVGIRTIKFGIVQILAPIPIANYITDEKKLSSWSSLALQIYADLFIRMGIIYFVIYFILLFLKSYVENLTKIGVYGIERVFVQIAVIIALLLFAKNAPKFICDLLGIKGADEGIGNMFKRAGGLLGTTFGALRTARSNYTTQKERYAANNPSNIDPKASWWKKKLLNKEAWAARAAGLKSAGAGFGSAAARGAVMAAQGKGFKDTRESSFKDAIAARNKRNDKLDNLYNRNVDKYIQERDANGKVVLDKNGNPKLIKNPDYYGFWEARRDVKREKLGIPSDTAFVKTRYDVMEQIAKVAADARGHGSSKMNETPSRYQVSFKKLDSKTGKYVFKDKDYETISDVLGYDSLSMEQVRNLYTLARNGQDIEHADGKTKVKLNANQLESLGSILQTIEKRTSYLKEAEMMGKGDPAASPNVDKMRMAIQNNKSMFNDPAIFGTIAEKLDDYGKKINSFDDLLDCMNGLQKPLDRKAFSSDDAYFKEVDRRADILNGIKDAFEEVTKQQFAPAQIADARAKRAQQAINNDKSGK